MVSIISQYLEVSCSKMLAIGQLLQASAISCSLHNSVLIYFQESHEVCVIYFECGPRVKKLGLLHSRYIACLFSGVIKVLAYFRYSSLPHPTSSSLVVCVLVFHDRFHCITLIVLELTLQTNLTLNAQSLNFELGFFFPSMVSGMQQMV